jgi:hypothetical protein
MLAGVPINTIVRTYTSYCTPDEPYHYFQTWSREKTRVFRFQNPIWRFDFPMKIW